MIRLFEVEIPEGTDHLIAFNITETTYSSHRIRGAEYSVHLKGWIHFLVNAAD